MAFSDPTADVWRTDCVAYLDGNRRLLAELLDRHLPGMRYRIPDATYLAWVDCTPLGLPEGASDDVPGAWQGAARGWVPVRKEGQGWVRINFATTRHILAEIVARMGQAVA